ncbi:MAG: mechanosensitive ion channel family protein [Chlamydiales bacterium]|nr:mechanosensitive ion channel family protein [Chlamydiales bacterium]
MSNIDFLKCLGVPKSAYSLFSIGLIIFACVLYWVLISLLRRAFRKDGVWKRLVEAIRFPCLFLLIEAAAIIILALLKLEKPYKEILDHALTLAVIATVGWLLVNIIRAIFRYFYFKYEGSSAVNIQQRSMITQVLFLYRLILFAIVAITLGSIFMTFPLVRSVGIGILSSAGIVGIALGIAARPILLNLMAGFQIAMTKTIKIGDAVMVEKEFAKIEAIQLTHVVARTWDLRRMILPISYFIDHPFQNWDAKDPELLGSVFLHLDYTAPVEIIRKKAEELITGSADWNKKVWRLHVTNCTEQTIELRIVMTANDASTVFELCSAVREKLIDFIQRDYPYALPCIRQKKLTNIS